MCCVSKRPVVAAAILDSLRHPTQVLCAARAYPQELAGLFELPRGKVEDGEIPEQALAREIREVMQEPEMQRRFTDNKLVPVVATRGQTEAMLKAYRAQWAPVVKTSGYNP